MKYSYKKLFTIPGAAKFSAAAFIGRLPAGMIGLAIILPISKLMGSYMIAGLVAASTMIGMALFAPISGKLVDRYGQCRILFIFAVLNLAGTLALIGCIQLDAPLLLLCIAGIITGASRLSTGTMARTRWAFVTRTLEPKQHEKALQTAYAFESIIDEVVFISAPILVTLLCTTIHPLAGLAACLISYMIGALTLTIQRNTQPPAHSSHDKQPFALRVSGLRIIFVATLFIGISAGAVEVIVVARAYNLGSRSLTGLLMATFAFASMLAGFWYGERTFKLPAHTLWIRCLGWLVLALLPFAFATNLVMLVPAMFLAGLLIAPTSIAGQLLIKKTLPNKLLNEGMSLIVTAMILGMAAGSWLSGLLIDKFGPLHTGAFPAVAVLIAFAIVITRHSKLNEYQDKTA